MIGELAIHEIEELLFRNIVGRIGCHAEGLTYIVPISYVYDGAYLYMHTREGLKTEIMRKNPEVCFEVDEMKNMANWKSVIVYGTYEELQGKELRNEALQKLMNRVLPIMSSATTHLSPNWPFPEDNLEDIRGIVFRIQVRKKTGRYEDNGMVSTTSY